MKKPGKKKLQLGTETIRALTSDNLVQAHGGFSIHTLVCGRTRAVGCDLPSDGCSMVGYENTCGSSLIG